MKRKGIPLEVTLAELDAKGKVIREQYVNSFHAAFIYAIGANLNNTDNSATVNDTAGVARAMRGANSTNSIIQFSSIGGAGDGGMGIIVGTGATAINKLDHNMDTPINPGTGAGQLQYGAMTANQPSSGVDSASYDLIRTFTNSSGGAITVQEVAWYFDRYDTGGIVRTFMADRTLFNKTLNPLDTLTLRYRLETV